MVDTSEKHTINQIQASAPTSDSRITINVGGRRFETFDSTLRHIPQSLLGDPQRRAAYFDPSRGEFFFDRSGAGFEAVLDVYRSGGVVNRPEAVPLKTFVGDLKFFGVGESFVNGSQTSQVYQPVIFGLRGRVWNLLEPPRGQPPILLLVSAVVTLTTLITWIVSTLPHLLYKSDDLGWVQLACVIILLIELIARAVSCPRPLQLILDPLTYVEFVATVPFIIGLIIHASSYGGLSVEDVIHTILIRSPDDYLAAIWLMRLARLAWCLRLWRFVRNTRAGGLLKRTLIASAPYLGVCLVLWIIGVLFFAAIFFWAEGEQEYNNVHSMPMAMWFTTVTMTTVGYGDIFPLTTAGRVFSAACAYYGYAIAALPIAVVVAKFAHLSAQDGPQ